MAVKVSKKPGGKKAKRGQTPKSEKPPKKEKTVDSGLPPPGKLSRAHPTIKLTAAAGGSQVTGGSGYRTAASSVVMSEGRHYAQFTVARAGKSMFFGVVRPEWDVESGKDAEEQLLKKQKPKPTTLEEVAKPEEALPEPAAAAAATAVAAPRPRASKHCFFSARAGLCYPGGQRWKGMDGVPSADGDRIGLLLDLTKGRLTVFKNEIRLGVMCSGKGRLTGEYCWAVSMLGNAGECVTIQGGRSAEEAEAGAVECLAATERAAAELTAAASDAAVVAAEEAARPALEQAAAELAATITAAEAAYAERHMLAFDLCHRDVTVSEDGSVAMKAEVRFGPGSEVMRSGYRTAAR